MYNMEIYIRILACFDIYRHVLRHAGKIIFMLACPPIRWHANGLRMPFHCLLNADCLVLRAAYCCSLLLSVFEISFRFCRLCWLTEANPWSIFSFFPLLASCHCPITFCQAGIPFRHQLLLIPAPIHTRTSTIATILSRIHAHIQASMPHPKGQHKNGAS